ncbi:hypothetical protein AB205_0117330 [Aquarana catesbeiana]|uniref:Uncharacterized protein n=1 Tax=Aquarana catesbeiana TaxID=8400 RepID=A0A2G9QL76_AQUCT|nr:hypothetical protein AB205_0117330 [Aquarana catesbeiana]
MPIVKILGGGDILDSPVIRVVRHRVLDIRNFRQHYVTVCMQGKFEPTSVGKNPMDFVVRMCDRVYTNAPYTRSDFPMDIVRSEHVVGNSDHVWAPSDIFHRIFRHTKLESRR